VTARIVPAGPCESVCIITLAKPDKLPLEASEAGMPLMDDELAALKARRRRPGGVKARST